MRPTPSFIVVVVALLVPFVAPAARAQQDDAPAGVAATTAADERACRAVAQEFMAALDRGDEAALRRTVYVDSLRNTDAQNAGLKAFADCVVAQREFEAALVARFPAAAPLVAATRFAPADYEALRNARFELRESQNEAALILGGSVTPILLRRQTIAPQWRVELRTVSTLYTYRRRTPEAGSQRRIDDLIAVARTVRGVAEQVRAGAFPTLDAATAALAAAIDKAAGK